MSDGRVPADTAANIRRVALDLFARQGYDRSSLREIAEALGISKAAVYYHYRTKVEILDDLLRPMVDEEEAIITEAEATADHLDDPTWRLGLVERYIDLMLHHRELMTYAMNDLAGVANSEHVARMRACDARLISLLSTGELTVEQRIRTSAAIGVIIAILTVPNVTSEELRPHLLTVVREILGLPGQAS